MIKTENFQRVEVTSAEALRNWLTANHTQKESVWLVTYKKEAGAQYLDTSQILDELLCFGWIDGIRRKLDAQRTMQLISPRQAQHWAKSYKVRVAKLTNEGRMHPAGLTKIEESKRSGLWDFMDDVDALIKPTDLIEALSERPGAAAFFDTIPPASQRFVLRWIKLSKRPETRARRIAKIALLAAENKRLPGS